MKCVIILFDIGFYNVEAPYERRNTGEPDPLAVSLWINVFSNSMMEQDTCIVHYGRCMF